MKLGHLNFDEFKNFIQSEEGNKAFKEILVNKENSKVDQKERFGNLNTYTPHDFR